MAKGNVSRGWSLVWRHQKILWCVFAVNFLVALVASWAPRGMFSRILDHSMNSDRLANGFDLPTFIELMSKPEVSVAPLAQSSLILSGLFFLFMLFITGGMLVAYREDRRLSMGEFFEASGAYFWRMVRLVLMSIVPFGICAAWWALVSALSGTLGDSSPNAKMGFYVTVGGGVVLVVLILITRLWFDVAQVRAVAQDERGMFRNVMRAFVITFRALPSLFWMYLRISLFGWAFLVLGVWGWTHLTGNHIFRVFLLWEIVLFAQLLTRLWQRASSVTWYGAYAEAHPAVAVDYTTPKPAEIAEPVAPAPQTVPPIPGPGEPS